MEELSWHDRGRLWFRLGLRLALTVLMVWSLARFGPFLLSLFAPFLLALIVAWLLSPAVTWLHSKLGVSRKLLSLILLLLVIAALGGILWGLLSAAGGELVSLAGDWEGLVSSLQSVSASLSTTFSQLMERLPLSARDTVDSLADQFFQWLETAIPRILSSAVNAVTDAVKGVPSFAVAAVVFLMASYFLTADYPRFHATLANSLPAGPRHVLSLVKRAASAGFGGYIKAQLILSVAVFFILLVGFLLIRQSYAILLALALAVLDFIPIIGSGTVMIPWAVIDLFLGNWRHAVGLMAVWILVALFRRVAEPKVLGNQTGLSPILSLISIYVGMKVGGVPGMILGPVIILVALNVCKSGVLDNTLSDVKLAARDVSAILRGSGGPSPPET